MAPEISKVVQHIFQKETLEEVPQPELENLVEEFPFFAAARLLLAKKLLATHTSTAEDEVATAALYFHNPLWFQWIINDKKIDLTTQQPMVQRENINPQSPEETDVLINDQLLPSESNPEVVSEPNEISTDSNLIESLPQPVNEPQHEPIALAQPEEHSEIQPEIGTQDISHSREEQVGVGQKENEERSSAQPNESEEQEHSTNGKPVDIMIEPYHTVDYFASQGIKLQTEDLGNDKLGQQLKSFTEWLRSMKRLPNADGPKIEEQAERVIQHIAEHSLEEKEILTETMAEVWAKQGNRERAIEIYKKLSLKNPSKSAYFAARIEQLK